MEQQIDKLPLNNGDRQQIKKLAGSSHTIFIAFGVLLLVILYFFSDLAGAKWMIVGLLSVLTFMYCYVSWSKWKALKNGVKTVYRGPIDNISVNLGVISAEEVHFDEGTKKMTANFSPSKWVVMAKSSDVFSYFIHLNGIKIKVSRYDIPLFRKGDWWEIIYAPNTGDFLLDRKPIKDTPIRDASGWTRKIQTKYGLHGE